MSCTFSYQTQTEVSAREYHATAYQHTVLRKLRSVIIIPCYTKYNIFKHEIDTIDLVHDVGGGERIFSKVPLLQDSCRDVGCFVTMATMAEVLAKILTVPEPFNETCDKNK